MENSTNLIKIFQSSFTIPETQAEMEFCSRTHLLIEKQKKSTNNQNKVFCCYLSCEGDSTFIYFSTDKITDGLVNNKLLFNKHSNDEVMTDGVTSLFLSLSLFHGSPFLPVFSRSQQYLWRLLIVRLSSRSDQDCCRLLRTNALQKCMNVISRLHFEP